MSKQSHKEKNSYTILIIALIAFIIISVVLLSIIKTPYSATETYIEKEPYNDQESYDSQEPQTDCLENDFLYSAKFYSNNKEIYGLRSQALPRFSELGDVTIIEIDNEENQEGIFSVKTELYFIPSSLTQPIEGQISFGIAQFSNMKTEGKELQLLSTGREVVKEVSMSEPLFAKKVGEIRLWNDGHISDEIKDKYNLENVFMLITVIPPKKEVCQTSYKTVENTRTITKYKDVEKQRTITKYETLWEALIGKNR